jgi:hypothetical protein
MRMLAACTVVAVLAGASTAGASRLITGRQVANGSLTGADIRDGSIRAQDLAGAPTVGLRGATGAPGARGGVGPAGPQGAPARMRVRYIAVKRTAPAVSIYATCPLGTVLLSGFVSGIDPSDVALREVYAEDGVNGGQMRFDVLRDLAAGTEYTTIVVCGS